MRRHTGQITYIKNNKDGPSLLAFQSSVTKSLKVLTVASGLSLTVIGLWREKRSLGQTGALQMRSYECCSGGVEIKKSMLSFPKDIV